jgi:hypothetical protein
VTRSIRRYAVPIDARWHPLKLSGPVVHVGRPPVADRTDAEERYVELWAEFHGDEHTESRYFRAFGTGDEIEGCCEYVGTGFGVGGRAVWHVMERAPGT